MRKMVKNLSIGREDKQRQPDALTLDSSGSPLIVYRAASLTAVATLVLIVIGGLVTSSDAGDSVPDWPLAFGQLVPWQQLVGNVLYEYGHRAWASTVGVLTIILNVLLWRYELRRWVRRLGLLALFAVIAQGTLGGIRVLLLEYRFPLAMVHACLAQLFFCLVVSLAVFSSPRWWKVLRAQPEHPATRETKAFPLCTAAIVVVFFQLILGAALRHKGIGIVPHVLGALAVTVLVSLALRSVVRLAHQLGGGAQASDASAELTRPAMACAVLLIFQLILGVAAYLSRLASEDHPQPLEPMVSLTVAHVAVGAMILAGMLIVTLRVYHMSWPASATLAVPSPLQNATT